ncbi:MAG: ATP-dependent DNA helicase [Gammaproteobacteria bacterium]
MKKSSEILSETGPVANSIEGFSPRLQQQEMADQIGEVLDQNGILIGEAGTGTGKTFAYLVPALMSGKKVIISTGTKHLQDQLFHRDLPVIREALKLPISIALLKGRANYLCLNRLGEAGGQGNPMTSKLYVQLTSINEWAEKTTIGDVSELSSVPEDSMIWPMVTSNADNCLGQECPQFSDCHVYKARKEANDADVLVVNHHLFMADMSLREGGFGEVLPGAEAVIFDEAHQLHDIASQFFGSSVTSRQLLDLSRDVFAAYLREASDMPNIEDAGNDLEKLAKDFRLALGRAKQRAPWHEIKNKPEVKLGLNDLIEGLQLIRDCLKPAAERGRAIENCLTRTEALLGRLILFSDQQRLEKESEAEQEGSEGTIQWFETYQRAFVLNITPLEISSVFKARRESYQCAWIFTSATLAVGENFKYFTHRLGLDDAVTKLWDSPFDYPNQALLYLPKLGVEPNHPSYTQTVVDASVPVLQASQGRAFVLFTSHRALKEAAELFAARLDFTLLIQGEAPKAELLERFRNTPSAVLLGTSSFWEGVDVRGEALSCVIIDKLPFASMGEPVMQARLDAMRKQGKNPFMEYQLPEAVITLKQGVGRLIRDVNDSGVLMICDPRISTKSYGRTFLSSLPAMRRVNEQIEVDRFFKSKD